MSPREQSEAVQLVAKLTAALWSRQAELSPEEWQLLARSERFLRFDERAGDVGAAPAAPVLGPDTGPAWLGPRK